MRCWVDDGEDVLDRLGDRLDDLHAAAGTQLTARRPWLQAWVETHRSWAPLAVGVDGDGGELAAVALLAARRVGPARHLVLLGHGPSDVLDLPARDGAAAVALADAVHRHLAGLRGPWHLTARRLATSEVARALVGRARARVVPGDVSPVLVADRGPDLDDYVSGSHRRGVSRVRNRLSRAGLAARTVHLEDPREIAAVMPEVERVMRARDAEVGRTSAVDVPHERDFFRAVVERHARLGQVRLTCLHVDDRLAAYVLCFLDGDVVRMWNPRFDPALGGFSPGKIAIDDSVRHALANGAAAYDFMRGEERYKASYANVEERTCDLSASSGLVVHAAEGVALRARDRLRRAEAGGGRAAARALAVRSLLDRR